MHVKGQGLGCSECCGACGQIQQKLEATEEPPSMADSAKRGAFCADSKPEVYEMNCLLDTCMTLHSDPIFAWIFGACTRLEAPLAFDHCLAWPCYMCMLKCWAICLVKTVTACRDIQFFKHIFDASLNFSSFYTASQQIDLALLITTFRHQLLNTAFMGNLHVCV